MVTAQQIVVSTGRRFFVSGTLCVRCGRPATHIFRTKSVCNTCPDKWLPRQGEKARVKAA